MGTDAPATRLRLFVAGMLPPELVDSLEQQLAVVRAVSPQVKWTSAETLHLTLVFLGSVDAPRVPTLTHELSEVARRHRPLSLELRGMVTFGPSRAPRVLAASLAGEVDELRGLVEDARARLEASVPLEPTRPFHPHLTVARSRSHGGDPMLARCRAALDPAVAGAFRLERMALFRSETLPAHAVHTPIDAWTLGS